MLGFHDLHLGGTKDKSQSKDLQRLNRQDLLELLVGQMREGDDLRAAIERNEREIQNLNDLADRLKGKLDLKDEQMENLKDKLDIKDAQIDHLKRRLDEKDARLEVLKGRLDFKDSIIARLSESQNMSKEELEIIEARERALENEEARIAKAEAETEAKDEELLDE